MTQLQSRVKIEEEKRTKSISLLRAVRQKLVQTEKDKTSIEGSFTEFRAESHTRLNEAQSEKSRLEEELSRMRITHEQQLSKLRHSFDREIHSTRSQFERDVAAKRSQFELDAITAKAAYERELGLRNQKIFQLETRLRDLSAERDRLFDQVQSQQAELEGTSSRIDETQGRAGELQHQLNDARDRVTALLEEVDRLRQLSTSQSQGEDGHRKLLTDLQSQHASQIGILSSRISQLEKERTDLELELGNTLKQRLKDIEKMRSESHLKSLEYADSMQNMAERNEQISKSHAQIKSLEDKLAVVDQVRVTQSTTITNLTIELVSVLLYP